MSLSHSATIYGREHARGIQPAMMRSASSRYASMT